MKENKFIHSPSVLFFRESGSFWSYFCSVRSFQTDFHGESFRSSSALFHWWVVLARFFGSARFMYLCKTGKIKLVEFTLILL